MQLWNWRGLDVINAHERDPARLPARDARGASRRSREGWLDPRRSTRTASARRAGRGVRGDAREPPGRLRQGAGDPMSAPSPDAGGRAPRRGSASSASAGSGGTGWRRSSRAGVAEVAAIADAVARARRGGAPGARRRAIAATRLDELLERRARRRGDRDAERAARRAGDRRARARAAPCSARSRSAATAAETRRVVDGGARGGPPARRRPLVPLHATACSGSASACRAGALGRRLRGRPRLPQRLRPGQAVVLRPRSSPAAAA